jgi:hypothetical protein
MSSELIEFMRNQAARLIPRGIELATVIAAPPALKIQIDHTPIVLDGDDLVVCEHLLDHTREYSTVSDIADSVVSEWEETTNHKEEYPTPNELRHRHDHEVEQLTVERQTVTVHTKLKAGDRVVVLALPGEQQYLVIDKVVVMSA